ncbi:MAG: phage major capsid protein [Alphaproteobacteria bacterium]|nr:phage major capsid protein [Alphaproteobacteria bacterium]MBN9566551.1 phage major capsid protein [Alphaproteobacteria bacterium]MBN9579732.1 phage major capsid protein [Alphaproteobacteria bacterium]MBN9592492.1 phage major capsid protein [Alphaproteobacteria bacterium]OJU56134.1 MAG: capsid protein [Alphaproteobacteria bacterium 62-8]
MELETKSLETKDAANTREIKEAFADFLSAFDAFKQANDARLQEIEKRGADVVTDEKVDRINRTLDEQKHAIDELMLAAARPTLGGEYKAAPDDRLRERKAAFDRYVRKGDAAGFAALELKSLSAGSDADGGYVVPLETEQTIDRVLSKASPIRAIAAVRQIGGNVYRKPIASVGAASGWVAETATPTTTNAPTLSAIDFPAMELYAMPAATQTLLDDAQVDIEQWLASEVQIVFAEQESTAFVTGDGSNKPKGFLSYTKVADASWAWDKIGYVLSGGDGAFAASAPTDALLDLVYAPKQGYRANAHWVMNRKTEAAMRKLTDEAGNYIWQPGTRAGEAASIFGYPVMEAEDMPDIASASYSIAFGDFARGYLIVDRVGIRTLRDPYSSKPYVLFYTTKRVGGGVQNFEAIKLMKFSAS